MMKDNLQIIPRILSEFLDRTRQHIAHLYYASESIALIDYLMSIAEYSSVTGAGK